MRRIVKKAISDYTSDTLTLGFALAWLLVFTYVLKAPEHIIGMGEDNLLILVIEMVVCAFAVVWSAACITKRILEARNVSRKV